MQPASIPGCGTVGNSQAAPPCRASCRLRSNRVAQSSWATASSSSTSTAAIQPSIPDYQYVDRQLHQRGLPSAEALASLPLELAHFDRYNPGQGAIELTVEALVAVDGAAEELDLFVRAVRWLARRELDQQLPSPTDTGHILVTSTEFAHDEGVELNRLQLAKILALPRVEWLTIGSGGPGEQEPIWQVTLDKSIRRYADVKTVDDYLAIKQRAAAEAASSRRPRGRRDSLTRARRRRDRD